MFVTLEFPLPSRVVSLFVTRLVLVHGSVGNAQMTWGQVLAPLRERFEVVLHTRSGYPPRQAEPRIDFEVQADKLAAELRPGDHLAGHSYGGVVSLLAAARNPVLASLTVSEPPAFGVARGNPAVEEFIARFEAIIATKPSPRDYLAQFAPLVGSTLPTPETLPPELERGAQAALAERPPYEAEIPVAELVAVPFPKLVISGGHHPAFDAVCDVLEPRLGAERAVLPGAGHSLPRAPGYAETLVSFVERATVVETERLVLRPLVPGEREQMLSIWLDAANERSPGEPPERVREWAAGVPRGVFERETGELIGDCGLFFADEHGEWELAYGLRRDRWGRGYATEAALACLRHGFEDLGLERIVADVDPANAGSVRVLEKCGFVHVGGAGDKLLYAVTPETSR